MKIKHYFWGLLLWGCAAYPTYANSKPVSLFNPDGSINLDATQQGNLNLYGYRMQIDPFRGPVLANTTLIAGWNAMGNGLDADVSAIVVSGTDLYVGGNFTDAGGITDADYLARWDGTSWNAVAPGLNNAVRSIAISGSDIYVGGQFLDAGGNTSADRIARWDGTSWNALGTGLNGTVWALGVSGTNVYAGGDFTLAGGVSNASYIARWNGSAWNAMGTGVGNFVLGITISGTDVYVAGGFANVGGNANADGVVRWNGSSWNALGTGGMNFWAATVVVYGSDVYVGGGFTDAGGIAAADYIARFDGSWHALGSGTGGPVYAIGVDGTGVYAGGNFFNVAGNPNADGIARWTGSAWQSLGTGLGSGVKAIATMDNNVFAGGDFLNGGGNSNINNIGRWENTPLPVELSAFSASLQNRDVLVRWETKTEHNNDYFEVEHSTDGLVFAPLRRVPGSGNSFKPQPYSILHDKPAAGKHYYRLNQVDFDGAAQRSNIVSAQVPGTYIQVLPNPVSSNFLLEGIGKDPIRLSLRNATGQLVLEQPVSEGVPVSMVHLPNGTYFAVIQGDRDVTVLPVVKRD